MYITSRAPIGARQSFLYFCTDCPSTGLCEPINLVWLASVEVVVIASLARGGRGDWEFTFPCDKE